jgi:hypothetical protein
MHFQMVYLNPLLAAGWLQQTIPGKPRSRLQRYRGRRGHPSEG